MLELGFASAILPNLTLEQVLDFAHRARFSCVEVMCWPSQNSDTRRYAGVSHIAVDQMDSLGLLNLKTFLSEFSQVFTLSAPKNVSLKLKKIY